MRIGSALLLLALVVLLTGPLAIAHEVAEWNVVAIDVLLAGGQSNLTVTRTR
jgi:hypothetical protein